ncbi:MAG: hypothetical protein ACYTG7_25920, partial [Planctomycetota bacterium]
IVERKATVDSARCIDCQRCIDRCSKENAIRRVPRSPAVVRYVDHEDVDQIRLKALCAKAGILPDLPVCGCLRVTGNEAAAAVLKGARTPEYLCAMTGLRAGCGLYCVTRIFQLLSAGGIELDRPRDRRWIPLTLSLADIPEDQVARIDAEYPQCRVGEDWSRVAKRRPAPTEKEETHG